MIFTDFHSSPTSSEQTAVRYGERGAALATAILMLGLLSAVALTVLAVVSTETRVAGSDMQRTQAFYAAASGIEKMSSDFNTLFARTSRPTQTSMDNIAAAPPDLSSEGFTFTQSIVKDDATLTAMRATQGITNGANPSVTVPNGPLVGLTAAVVPYILNTTATSANAQVNLERRMNNYLVPIFQFGMFSNEDMEVHPGPAFTFNGRVHANGNLYVNGVVTFLDKVTTASDIVRDVLRNGGTHSGTVTFNSGTLNEGNTAANCAATNANCASVILGPNTTLHPDSTSASGSTNMNWNTNSVARYAGQLLTSGTGVAPLKLPLQLDGNPTREIIKRRTPNDDVTLSDSRYHSKAEIRILLDDEGTTTDRARSSANPLNGDGTTNAGVDLSTFIPDALPNVLSRVNDFGTLNGTDTGAPVQQQQNGTAVTALTVRGVQAGPPRLPITAASNANPIRITSVAHGFSTGDKVFISGVAGNTAANGGFTITKVDSDRFTLNSSNGNGSYSSSTGTVYSFTALQKSGTVAISSGAGLRGHILIQIVDSAGVLRDVTQKVLSMGVTEGEPNGIVYLQRPLWAAYTQGSRDGSGGTNQTLAEIMNNTNLGSNGEILSASVVQNTNGYLTSIGNDTSPRDDNPLALDPANFTSGMWNSIVPINLYNVREGRINNNLDAFTIWERGVTSVVEINMKNLARWMDSAYDANVLSGTAALSTNIGSPDGYIVYVSDRRGDVIKSEIDSTNVAVTMTNGMCDNEDIYGGTSGMPNGILDPGEDVIDFGAKKGTLQNDEFELPDPANFKKPDGSSLTVANSSSSNAFLTTQANYVAAWKDQYNYFRRAVRLFNGENLKTAMTGTTRLSATKGITMASENMLYIWGNYNTTGINQAPASGASSLNDSTQNSHYCPGPGSGAACGSTTDTQVPASIVCDAFFPLSKTWFDSVSAMWPDDLNSRPGDRPTGSTGVQTETSVRTGIIAGNNLSALSATSASGPDVGNWNSNPDNNESRLNGGMHNFPRFLEAWADRRFNFVGSLIPLYHSTQAMGQYGVGSVYSPPTRNWAFDITFRQSDRLPPGTPQFQYVEPTAFRQILY